MLVQHFSPLSPKESYDGETRQYCPRSTVIPGQEEQGWSLHFKCNLLNLPHSSYMSRIERNMIHDLGYNGLLMYREGSKTYNITKFTWATLWDRPLLVLKATQMCSGSFWSSASGYLIFEEQFHLTIISVIHLLSRSERHRWNNRMIRQDIKNKAEIKHGTETQMAPYWWNSEIKIVLHVVPVKPKGFAELKQILSYLLGSLHI